MRIEAPQRGAQKAQRPAEGRKIPDYAPANMSDVLRNLIEVGLDVREDNRPVSAPIETIMERLAARSPGNYGHVADERRKVADLISTIEPLLRESADQEIDTRRPTTITVDEILRIV
jgi:hypothetical protein